MKFPRYGFKTKIKARPTAKLPWEKGQFFTEEQLDKIEKDEQENACPICQMIQNDLVYVDDDYSGKSGAYLREVSNSVPFLLSDEIEHLNKLLGTQKSGIER